MMKKKNNYYIMILFYKRPSENVDENIKNDGISKRD